MITWETGPDGEQYPALSTDPASAAEALLRTGRDSAAVTEDFRLWLWLAASQATWMDYCGTRSIPKWRLRVNFWYHTLATRVAADQRKR